jgi:hypothetical protein
MPFDKARIYFAFCEQVVRNNIKAGGYRRFDWLDNKFAQGPFHCGYRIYPVGLMD